MDLPLTITDTTDFIIQGEFPIEVIIPEEAPSVEEFNLNRQKAIPPRDCWVYMPDRGDILQKNPSLFIPPLNGEKIIVANPIGGYESKPRPLTYRDLQHGVFQWSSTIFHSSCRDLTWRATRYSEYWFLLDALNSGVKALRLTQGFAKWVRSPRSPEVKKEYIKLEREFREELHPKIKGMKYEEL